MRPVRAYDDSDLACLLSNHHCHLSSESPNELESLIITPHPLLQLDSLLSNTSSER
ncbi:hypothetical protein RchiOBHm_Chr3g0475561 [Rosa chinensis]|uniref:Uncharacterized protein n=1 Tax=Rosa chinensis TaxID=74649 RepID=A0A2P6RCG2_ROSCH|nr:hypothetical protein RchiOBHm_Chr3g0475561 [Rosa chinensis]